MKLVSSWFPLALFAAGALLVPSMFSHLALFAAEEPATVPDPQHHVLDVVVTAVECPEGYDNMQGDDVCLAYNGQIPGPTWVFHEGDTVTMHLTNAIWPSILETSLSAADPAWEELTTGNISLHRHGLALAASEDGIPHEEGTRLIDSTAGPNQTVTYEFETRFVGAWHYHDHVLGFYMADGKKRGLYGAFMVLPRGETTQALDLHVMDSGVHGGLGYSVNVTAGERFDLDVVGLGNFWWTVTLDNPDGTRVGAVTDIGPGVSRALTVDAAKAGTYTWTARTPFFRDAFTGEVVAQ